VNLDKILKHSLLKSSLIYVITDAINKAVPFLILPILSYYLLPSDYGIVANFGVLVSIISIFVLVGVNGAIAVNYFKLSKEELSRYIFNGITIIGVFSFILLFIVLLFNETIYLFVKVPLSYQLLAVATALASALTGINLSLWRLEEKPVKFGVYQISQTALNLGASLVLIIVYKLGWVGRINGMLVATLSFGLLSLILIYKRGYLRIKFNHKLIFAILAFGLPLIPHSLSFWLRSGVDRILITKYIGEAATGLYATGFQFGILIAFLTGAFNNAFVPYMYKLLSEKDESILDKNKENLKKMILIGIVGLIILCVLFTLLSNIVLTTFFSDRYSGASEFIFWAILSQTFQGMYLFFVNYIFYVKKTKGLAAITFTCAILQVILSYILIINIGAIGAAYATALVSFVNFVMIAWYSNKVYPMGWIVNK
jgi:O-antigen/teichoic acid export membrane protein